MKTGRRFPRSVRLATASRRGGRGTEGTLNLVNFPKLGAIRPVSSTSPVPKGKGPGAPSFVRGGGTEGCGLCDPRSPKARDRGHPHSCVAEGPRGAVCAIPGPQVQGTGGTLIRAWRRDRGVRSVRSPVPKCKGPGAPSYMSGGLVHGGTLVHVWWLSSRGHPRSCLAA